jgi:hypothetical protein
MFLSPLALYNASHGYAAQFSRHDQTTTAHSLLVRVSVIWLVVKPNGGGGGRNPKPHSSLSSLATSIRLKSENSGPTSCRPIGIADSRPNPTTSTPSTTYFIGATYLHRSLERGQWMSTHLPERPSTEGNKCWSELSTQCNIAT